MKRPCHCHRVTSAVWDASQCRLCWLAAHDPRYSKLFSGATAATPTARRAPCDHLGKVLDRGGCNCPGKWLHQCDLHEQCRTGPTNDGVRSCLGCGDYERDQDDEPPLAGVVIGGYNLPRLMEVQIQLIREHNGPRTPILIVDDCSPGTGRTPDPRSVFGDLCAIMRRHEGVTLWSNPERYGHAGGDLASYFVGLQWARVHGLRVLCKLSQRMLIDLPYWLLDAAGGLLESGMATGCNPCQEGASIFPLRTEAILFDVARWHRQDILDHLRPRPVSGVAAEIILWDDLQDRLDRDFWRWPIMGHDRMTQYPGIIWHCSHGRHDYEAIAARYNLPLDEHFTVAGWQGQPNYQW